MRRNTDKALPASYTIDTMFTLSAVVLDDQLVQSDVNRMDWFRALLAEKARAFQIIVFTCRPADYVSASAMPSGKVVHKDTDGGFIRATALDRVIQRR